MGEGVLTMRAPTITAAVALAVTPVFLLVTVPAHAASISEITTKPIDQSQASTLGNKPYFNKESKSFSKGAAGFERPFTEKRVYETKAYQSLQKADVSGKKSGIQKNGTASSWSQRGYGESRPTGAGLVEADQKKKFDLSGVSPVAVPEKSPVQSRGAAGFDKTVPTKEYRGRMPMEAQSAMNEKNEKVLTVNDVKELLNKNR